MATHNEPRMTQHERRLPVGIQSFEEIRREGYLYVDKTDLVWLLANKNVKYNYLSRPRRFGKSVLVDTLQCYLEGKKELFEGLKITKFEKDWVARPVIRLDMSRGGASGTTLRSYLDLVFGQYEEIYGITPKPTAQLADRFDSLIRGAYLKADNKWLCSLTSTTLRCNTPGKRRNTKNALPFTVRFLPYLKLTTLTKSSCSSPASRSSRRFRCSLC